MYRVIPLIVAIALLTALGLWIHQTKTDYGLSSPRGQERESQSADGALVKSDEEFLAAAHIPNDDAGLIAFLQKHTATDDELRNPDLLIGRLASDDFQVREDASRKLIALGARCLPNLKRAIGNRDPEIRERAGVCLARLRMARHLCPELFCGC